MEFDFASLLVIVTIGALCPAFADRIPGKIIPETVFLLVIGAILGPYGLDLFAIDEPVSLLSELGMAFLFLLAGYEINPDSLTGSQGRAGLATWAASFAFALVFGAALPAIGFGSLANVALAIALTTTAIGTLMPILKERGVLGTAVGDSIISYGTWGEVAPIIAIVMLLSARSAWKSAIILLGLAILCVLIARHAAGVRERGSRFYRSIEAKADTTSQTFVRLTIWLLMLLVTISDVFDLDIVLGAFAAGFTLRSIMPDGDHALEHKLDAIGFGFFIPVFFVVSGGKIDVASVFAQPALLIALIVALVVIRAIPIFVATSIHRETRDMPAQNRASVAIYCATALPLIVAVTSIAVRAGAMPQDFASTFVAAGAITVFLMPLVGQLAYQVVDAQTVHKISREAAGGESGRSADEKRRLVDLGTRFKVERMVYSDAPARDVAIIMAESLGFAEDDPRIDAIAARIESIRRLRGDEVRGLSLTDRSRLHHEEIRRIREARKKAHRKYLKHREKQRALEERKKGRA